MKNFVGYFFVTIMIASCVNTEKKYTKFLTNGSRKHWNLVYQSHMYNKKKTSIYPKYRDYYLINGRWFPQWYYNGAFIDRGIRDLPQPNTWRLLGDSIIVYDHYDSVRIIMLTNDTLKYLTKTGDTLIFRNSSGDTSFNHRIKRPD